jgi:OOP family OmpA-OmpF porin
MKNILYVLAALPFITMAQTNDNLAANGSFEAITTKPDAPGLACKAIGVSSANCTTVDLFSQDARNNMVKVPVNYMGSQNPSTGENYVGIVAFYGDEAGVLRDKPGYQSYTEYLQVELTQPLIAGNTYNINLKVSLADNSAYAVSGLGIVMAKDKMKLDDNSFLFNEPDMVSMNVIANDDWTTIQGSYTADGGEKFLIFGAFAEYMVVEKIIPDNVNNSRKAYYYIDDISVTPSQAGETKKDISFTDGCFKLKNLNFESDKAVILPESYKELDALADFLKNYPTLTIYIDGYADKTGTDKINLALSANRASAVKNYLVDKGVNADNLVTRWYGSEYPVTEFPDNSKTNRRVEILACCFK